MSTSPTEIGVAVDAPRFTPIVREDRPRPLMFSKLSKRRTRRILVVEFNPWQILAAKISRSPRGPMALEAAAEFDRDDIAGFDAWLESNDEDGKGWMTIVCGIVPRQGVLLRENVQTRRLAEPDYLADLVQDQQKGRFLTSTPFKVLSSATWTLRAVSAMDGDQLVPDGTTRPALICGMANDETREIQQRLIDHRVIPDRIEPGLLSLFGAIYGTMEQRDDQRAVVVIVIHPGVTAVYILGKKGVHTPNPVLHGFDSIVELARKQLGAKDDAEARSQLQNAGRELLGHAAKLVWRIGRDLKPVVDSFEMATGQPAEEIFCANLPPGLGWISEPLARVAGRTHYTFDCNQWLPTAGLQVVDSGRRFGPHWLGVLSLAAHLPDESGAKVKREEGADPAFHRPWHVDCRIPDHLNDRKFAGRRLLAGAIAGTVVLFAAAATAWQLYATQSLRSDTRHWEKQMTESRKLFDELTAATAGVKSQSAVLDRAHELMASPYQLSDFIINLGRTIPARLRVDRIETNDLRIAISGAVLEPAEEASRTLGRYMDELRRNPAIGPLFSSIAITSLHRKTDADAVIFELTLRLQR